MIIAETGFWVALGNPKDDDHALALKTFGTLNEPLITTWPVMTEAAARDSVDCASADVMS